MKREDGKRKADVTETLDLLEAVMQKLAVAAYNSPDLPAEARTIAATTHTDLEAVFEALE